MVNVLRQRGVVVLSGIMGFVFFLGNGVNGFGFIDFPVTELRGSPEETVVTGFLMLGTFGTLDTLEGNKNLFSVPFSVTFRRCKAKASWIHVAASSNRFSISSAALTSGV
jgi:hypothetical protein